MLSQSPFVSVKTTALWRLDTLFLSLCRIVALGFNKNEGQTVPWRGVNALKFYSRVFLAERLQLFGTIKMACSHHKANSCPLVLCSNTVYIVSMDGMVKL